MTSRRRTYVRTARHIYVLITTKMREQVFLLCVITLLRSASGKITIKSCNDCTLASSCRTVTDLIRTNEATAYEHIGKAFCGFNENYLPKVCCSMLSNPELRNTKQDIESIHVHPNVQLLPESCGVHVASRNLGGFPVEPHEYPWMALIAYRTRAGMRFFCSGALINERYVLTAAHCITKRLAGVRIGEFNLDTKSDCRGTEPYLICEDPIQDLKIEETMIHPNFQREPVFDNDIGLLRLKKPVNLTFENAKTICLPVSKDLQNQNVSGISARITGWGISEIGSTFPTPGAIDVQIHSQRRCDSELNSRSEETIDFTNKLCAGGDGRIDRIMDDGGPLMVASNSGSNRFIQRGINSYTISRRDSVVPTVYTDVSKYMTWILDSIKP